MNVTVDVKWMRKDESKRKFKANTYTELLDEIKKKKSTGAKIGDFTWDDFEYEIKKGKKSGDYVVVLKVGYETTLPVWPAAKKADKKEKEAWDKALKALAKHEEIHRRYLLESVAMFSQKIAHMKDPDADKIDAEFKALQKEHKSKQDAYDSRTQHGEKEGAFLPAPDKL